jgi:ComF family protein
VKNLLRDLVDLLLPPACAGCGRALEGEHPLCPRCNRGLPRLAQNGRVPCAGPREPLDACLAAVAFEAPFETWMHRFKYPRPGLAGLDPGPAAVVRALILEAGARAPGPAPSLVVPVPLHPGRLRARGFNPAAILARALARRVAAPWAPTALRRVRDTPSQTGLDRRQRRRNLRGAFQARPGLDRLETVWLVDDVVTTGSTVTEAARALRRAGATSIVAICAAWTQPPEGERQSPAPLRPAISAIT